MTRINFIAAQIEEATTILNERKNAQEKPHHCASWSPWRTEGVQSRGLKAFPQNVR